jgi:hypothetical protein
VAIGTDETRAAPAIPGDPADDGLDDPRLRDLRETQALPPDRRSVLLIGEPPPAAGAPVQERIAHQARETLRDTAHALVALDDGHPDRLAAHLFRSRLSTLYVDMREQLRQYAPRSDDDMPGEARHHRLLEVLGPLDRTLIEALDHWSAVLATGSTDAQRYLAAARAAREAVEAVLERMDRARDPGDQARPLFPGASPEQHRVALAVRTAAVELGLEAGEVLAGRVAPLGDPMAGLRRRLAEVREDQKRLAIERNARMGGPLLAARALRPMHLGALDGATVKALTSAAIVFDTVAPDPVALETAADRLLGVVRRARAAGATLRESDRQEVRRLADLLQEIVAERLERWPGPLRAKAATLRAALPTLPLPPADESPARFWNDRKAEVLAALPAEISAQVGAALSPHLGAELTQLASVAAAGDDAATEEQGWAVLRILRADKATAARLPVSRADAKARLHVALDAVALSVQRLLPPSPGIR